LVESRPRTAAVAAPPPLPAALAVSMPTLQQNKRKAAIEAIGFPGLGRERSHCAS
jgi:hypothetical protein